MNRPFRGYDDQDIARFLENKGYVLSVGIDDTARSTFDEATFREAWLELKDTLLPKWIRQHPRSRPYAWWRYDAPERRKRIDGKPHPFGNPEQNAAVNRIAALPDAQPQYREWSYRLCYGKPIRLIVPDDHAAKYETQVDFLSRLELLNPDE